MRKYLSYFIHVLLLCVLSKTYGQDLVPQRLTTSSGGSSTTIIAKQGNFYFAQSIGQSGVINSYSASAYQLRQGFIQPLAKAVATSQTRQIDFKIFPNPFSNSVTILFQEQNHETLNVEIFDMYGKSVLKNQYKIEHKLLLNLNYLQQGIYLLKINTYNMRFTSLLIKE